MKTLIACILATILAATGSWGPALAGSPQGQPIAADVWDQAPANDDWDPAPTDSGYLDEITLDKSVYSTGDISIHIKLPDSLWETDPWNADPVTVEIIQQDTGSVVFYCETREASLTIDIDLHPGEYLLRARQDMDWDMYWHTYWSSYWDTGWDTNWETNYPTVRFSVVGTSDLLHLTAYATAEKYPETDVLLGARLEWDGPSDAGPYTLTRTEARSGEITLIEDIRTNCFVEEGLLLGAVYTYTVSDGNMASNPIVIDLSAVPPLEYAGIHNDKVIVLKIGDPYLYSAPDKDLACEGLGLEIIRLIDGNDRGVVPVIKNNRTMIPIAALVEEMGGSADWDGSKRLVTVNLWDSTMMQHNTLEIPIGSNTVYLNSHGVTFDTAARIERSRTLVPIRLLELLGCDVEWVDESKSVVICYQGSGNVG